MLRNVRRMRVHARPITVSDFIRESSRTERIARFKCGGQMTKRVTGAGMLVL